MKYKIISTSAKGDFSLINSEEEEMFALQYDNWFTSTGKTEVDNKSYSIESKNIWQNEFFFNRGLEKIGSITFNFKGDAIINLHSTFFRLKFKGLINGKFELIDGEENILAVLKPSIKWTKMRYEYDVETSERLDAREEIKELLLITSYAANISTNYYMQA